MVKKKQNVVGIDIDFKKPENSDLKITNNFDRNSLKDNLNLIKNLIKKNA